MLADPWGALGGMRDQRQRPIIPAARVAQSLVIMMLTRLGSLHALEQTKPLPGWTRALGGPLPSADTIARSLATLDLEALRQIKQKDRSGQEYARTQYYHRYVAGILVTRDLNLLLDEEPLRPGEDEIAAAVRLVTRLEVRLRGSAAGGPAGGRPDRRTPSA